VEHLVRLVDDLLDVARLTRGKIELRRRTVNVSDVLNHAIEMASLLLEQRNHRLTVQAEPDLVWSVDAARMAQVVSNLLTNAARYSAVGEEVRLCASRGPGDTIEISVRDNGIGISERMLPRVFDLFFQGKRNLDRAEGGLGIGLALVKNLVELHGGNVGAASAGPGRGSEFTIRVPARAAGHAHRSPGARAPSVPSERTAHAAPPPKNGCRILLVDDNVDAVEALALLLGECGHRVEAVHDPAAALQIVGRFKPEIAVVDIGLPVMDGYELIGSLRAMPATRECMFIALTGYGQQADRLRSEAAGFEHHLVKPVDLAHLTRLIDAFQAEKAAHAAESHGP
jgi:CheY-like chemotaxis protein/two-component sensor histidine kinase